MNRYLVGFTKLCLVYETRVVDAYTIQDAKDMILADECAGEFSDQYVAEDISVQEIRGVTHLRMLEVADGI